MSDDRHQAIRALAERKANAAIDAAVDRVADEILYNPAPWQITPSVAAWRKAFDDTARDAQITFHRNALPGVDYELKSETRRTADRYVTTYTWTPRPTQAYFRAMAIIEQLRDRLATMTEDEILEAAQADPIALARAYEAKADQVEAAAATSPSQAAGAVEAVKSFRAKAAKLRAGE